MNKYVSTFLTIVAGMLFSMSAMAYSGSRLWLPVADSANNASVTLEAKGVTASVAAQELRDSWHGKDRVVLREKRDKTLGAEGYRIVP